MKRRDFIAKALTAVAAIPLVGKLVNSQPSNLHEEILMVAQSRNISYQEAKQYIDRAWMRDRIVREAKENGQTQLTPFEFAGAFTDWDWQQIDGWCVDNAIQFFANPDRTITAFHVWRVAVRNEFASL